MLGLNLNTTNLYRFKTKERKVILSIIKKKDISNFSLIAISKLYKMSFYLRDEEMKDLIQTYILEYYYIKKDYGSKEGYVLRNK